MTERDTETGSVPELSDDDLMTALRALWNEFPPVPEAAITTANELFTWRTIDADLESLSVSFDSLLHASSAMRSSDSPRRIVFDSPLRGLELEMTTSTISGQLLPAQEGEVTLLTTKGETGSTQADALGLFSFERPARGPIRLRCTTETGSFVTEWIAFPPSS